MPFDQPFPRSFNTSSIREYAPPISGIYGLCNAREWIYIGETDNIQLALLDPDPKFLEMQPTGFRFEICDRASRGARQERLIREYAPSGNR